MFGAGGEVFEDVAFVFETAGGRHFEFDQGEFVDVVAAFDFRATFDDVGFRVSEGGEDLIERAVDAAGGAAEAAFDESCAEPTEDDQADKKDQPASGFPKFGVGHSQVIR